MKRFVNPASGKPGNRDDFEARLRRRRSASSPSSADGEGETTVIELGEKPEEIQRKLLKLTDDMFDNQDYVCHGQLLFICLFAYLHQT